MARYVWRDGCFRDPSTHEPMPIPERDGVCCPDYMPDTPGYHSPIDGRWIEGRRARRYDLESNNCVEYEPSLSPVNPERFGEKKRKAREAERDRQS